MSALALATRITSCVSVAPRVAGVVNTFDTCSARSSARMVATAVAAESAQIAHVYGTQRSLRSRPRQLIGSGGSHMGSPCVGAANAKHTLRLQDGLVCCDARLEPRDAASGTRHNLCAVLWREHHGEHAEPGPVAGLPITTRPMIRFRCAPSALAKCAGSPGG